MKRFRRLLAMFLTISMLLGMVSVSAVEQEDLQEETQHFVQELQGPAEEGPVFVEELKVLENFQESEEEDEDVDSENFRESAEEDEVLEDVQELTDSYEEYETVLKAAEETAEVLQIEGDSEYAVDLRDLQEQMEQMETCASDNMKDTVDAFFSADDEDMMMSEAAFEERDMASTRFPALPKNGDFTDGRLLVKVARGVSLHGADSVFDGIASEVTQTMEGYVDESDGVELMEESLGSDWYTIDLAEGVSMYEAWMQLHAEESVLYVQPEYILQAYDMEPVEIESTDPFSMMQEWYALADADDLDVENPGATAKQTIVAVVDTGVDLDHPDLVDCLLPGYDFVDDDTDPDDEDGHGTMVSGVIAAQKNAIGVRGLATDTKILPVRVLGADGGTNDDIANAIVWAAGGSVAGVPANKNKADVINLSLGGPGWDQKTFEAVSFARSQGCMVVAAAGNEGMPTTYAGDYFYGVGSYPAGYPGVLGVMAMDTAPAENGDWLADFSNYDADPNMGEEYAIMAPGVAIYTTTMDGEYGAADGTSFSCPVVSAAAAILMGMECTKDEVWEILISTGTTMQGKTQPDGTVRSYPALNVEAAVEMKDSGSTAYKRKPLLAEPYVYGTLGSVNLGNGAFNMEGLNTEDNLVFYNGKMLSGMEVLFTNLGGSGSVKITGTIGGVSMTAQTVSMVPGQRTGVPIKLTKAPSYTTDGIVSIKLYANGELFLDSAMDMIELIPLSKLGFTLTSSGGTKYYVAKNQETEVKMTQKHPVAVVMEYDLAIPVNSLVTISGSPNAATVLYQASNADILMQENAAYNSYLVVGNIQCLATETFTILGTGYTGIVGCFIHDPWIEYFVKAELCKFTSTKYKTQVRGQTISCCGIYDCPETYVACNVLANSLVNSCPYSVLVAPLASGCSLIENFYYADVESVLAVITNNATSETGFQFSNAVGPTCFYYVSGENLYPARVNCIYFQQTWDQFLTYSNAMVCNTSSSIATTSISTAKSWGHLADSPAFATGGTVEWTYNPEHGSVLYTLKLNMSTPIRTDYYPYVMSPYDSMGNHGGFEIPYDGSTVTFQIETMATAINGMNEYWFSGVVTRDYSYTSGGKTYTHYFYPAKLYSQIVQVGYSLYDAGYYAGIGSMNAQLRNGKVVITWADAAMKSGATAELQRSVDGGAYTKIASISNALNGTYTDSTVSVGHIYRYRLFVTNGSDKYVGYATCVYTKQTAHGGEDLGTSVNANALTVSLKSPWGTGGDNSLCYTVPAAMADKISFSNMVLNSGLSYGAVKNEDGTVSVIIGLETEYGALPAGTLFTLTPRAGVTCSTLSEGVCAKSSAGLDFWNLSNNKLVIAGYESGRMKGAGVAAGWNSNCSVKAPQSGSFKMFCLKDNWAPASKPKPIS